RRIVSRFAVWSNVNAHEGEIPVVARPLEVVGVAAEETDTLWRRVDDPHISQRQVGELVIGEPFVHWLHSHGNAFELVAAGHFHLPRLLLNRGAAFARGRGAG